MDLSINCLNLVPYENLPKKEEIKDAPIDNLSKLYNIFLRMEEICKSLKGVGLAAPQLGLPYNMFICMDNYSQKYNYYVNAEIIYYGPEKGQSLEGCLSIRSENGRLRHFQVERSKIIYIKCLKLNVDEELKLEVIKKLELKGLDSIVFQHEMDHCLGLSVLDKGEEFFIY